MALRLGSQTIVASVQIFFVCNFKMAVNEVEEFNCFSSFVLITMLVELTEEKQRIVIPFLVLVIIPPLPPRNKTLAILGTAACRAKATEKIE